MSDIQDEHVVIGILNDLLDYVHRYPLARGVIQGKTADGVTVEIKITDESSDHCDPE